MRWQILLCSALLLIAGCQNSPDKNSTAPAAPQDASAKSIFRVFYVNSYHQGYPWSDGIERSIRRIMQAENTKFPAATRVELASFQMDSKRRHTEAEISSAAAVAFLALQKHAPDLVIVSDDNAIKALIVPYLLDKQIPVVFCGLNWDSSKYHLPAERVTGMIEVQPVDQLLKALRPFARNGRIAFLKGDDYSTRIETDAIQKRFGLQLDTRLVNSFDQWRNQYLRLQKEADILILGNPASIPDWDEKQALLFVMKNSRIPSGSWDAWMARYVLATFATSPEEHGEWAARTALRILQGTAVSSIPEVQSKQARVYLNMPLANQLKIHFPMSLVEHATLIRE